MSFAARTRGRTYRNSKPPAPSRPRSVTRRCRTASAGIRSYVVEEPDGRIGTFCVYQARDPEAIREHARRVGMPGDQISPVVATVVVRDDPAAASAAA